MSKIFSFYNNGLDKTWYESSNVKYSECTDKAGELKQVKVVFNNGSQYLYKDVDVNDYLLFREAESQGKALNHFLKQKKYEYEKLEPQNIDLLNEELAFRTGKGLYVANAPVFEIKNSEDKVVFSLDKPLDDEIFKMVKDILNALGNKIKEIS